MIAAATTFQKPPEVGGAAERALRTMTTPGRGGYPAAERAAETVFRCRSEAAALFHVPSEEQVVFTSNATHGLNIAIKSLVRPGDRVLVSGYEHNAVTRPLCGMQGVQVQVASGPLFDRAALLEQFLSAAAPGREGGGLHPCIQCIRHGPAHRRDRGAVPGAGNAADRGCIPVGRNPAGGSAGLGRRICRHSGPQGAVRAPGHRASAVAVRRRPAPLIEGGTGSMSLLKTMPADLPDRLEAGTQNIPGIAGLLEGLRFVRRIGPAAIARHERDLIRCAAEGLRALPEAQVFAGEAEEQSGVLSFRLRGRDCEGAAAWFAGRDIALRAGYHCAPLAHKTAGTLDTGTIRLSVAAFNTAVRSRTFCRRRPTWRPEKIRRNPISPPVFVAIADGILYNIVSSIIAVS